MRECPSGSALKEAMHGSQLKRASHISDMACRAPFFPVEHVAGKTFSLTVTPFSLHYSISTITGFTSTFTLSLRSGLHLPS
jgi:hypothetical protein